MFVIPIYEENISTKVRLIHAGQMSLYYSSATVPVLDFTNHRTKTNRAVLFSCSPFPNILKYRDHR